MSTNAPKVTTGECSYRADGQGKWILTSLDGSSPPDELKAPFDTEDDLHHAVRAYRRRVQGAPW